MALLLFNRGCGRAHSHGVHGQPKSTRSLSAGARVAPPCRFMVSDIFDKGTAVACADRLIASTVLLPSRGSWRTAWRLVCVLCFLCLCFFACPVCCGCLVRATLVVCGRPSRSRRRSCREPARARGSATHRVVCCECVCCASGFAFWGAGFSRRRTHTHT